MVQFFCACRNDCGWLLPGLLEVRHYVFGEQFHIVKHRRLRKAAPVEHHHQVGHADRFVFFDFLNATLRVPEDRHGVQLVNRGMARNLADLAKVS